VNVSHLFKITKIIKNISYYDTYIPVKKIEITAVGIRRADHAAPSIRKSWHYLRRQAAVARSV
jgi:hypothetical protein